MTITITRRGFIRNGLAMGGLAAVSSLPVLADDPTLFPGRGQYERREEAFKDLTRVNVKAAYPFDIVFNSTVVNGVNFVTMDDVYGYVTPNQVVKFRAEAAKGWPIVLCMHVPFLTDGIWLAHEKFWRDAGKKFTSDAEPPARGDRKVQLEDPATRDFIAYLKTEPRLKAILAGHLHITVQERFSPTAIQYVVGGNFMFHGQEMLFS